MSQHPPTDSRNPLNGTVDREKSKSIRPLRALGPYLARYKASAIAALIALLFTAAVSLLMPVAVRLVIDGFGQESIEQINRYFAAALGLGALLAIGTGIRYALVSRLGERVVADIRKSAFAKAISLSPSFYERNMTGEVLSRINTDTTLVLALISSTISVAMRHVLMLPGGLALMFVASPVLAAYVVVLVPVVLIPVLAFGRKLKNLSRDSQDRIAEGSGNASEVLLSVQAVQANTHEEESRSKFDEIVERSVEVANSRIAVRAVMTILIMFLATAAVVAVTWIGAAEIRDGSMTWGELVQFVIYSVMIAGSAAALSEIWGELLRAAGAVERLVELLDAADTVVDPSVPLPLPAVGKGEVRFERVEFRYPMRREVAALNDVSFKVSPGETVALVGPSGAGKSTVFQLLLRFYDPTAGRVLLDGVDLSSMRKSDFRSRLALVPQDSVVFADTAKENIRFGRSGAEDEEIFRAAEAGAAHEFLDGLPDKYETLVGERGVLLSGGQKQRIAISRAILRNAPVLLLDEATSALDAESEIAVQAAVEKMSKQRTTLVIAHRLATVRNADRILVFDNGRIVDEGTHESLVAKGGLYARLARLQFSEGGRVHESVGSGNGRNATGRNSGLPT